MAQDAKAKSITEAQFNMFMEGVREIEKRYDDDYIKFWENIYYCASELGLRSVETCKIKVEHIDFFEKTLLLPEQKNKEKFEKIICSDFLLERLKDHILTYKSQIVLSDNYIFWRQKGYSGGQFRENHLNPSTIRTHTIRARKKSGLDHKYAKSRTGHQLSVLSYHTLRHYYLQKICDKRGVFAAQICGRHKNLRSTERYIKSSLQAKRDIVNSVFNTVEEKHSVEITELKNQITELTNLVKVIATPQSEACTPATNKFAQDEAIMMLQNDLFTNKRKNRVD